MARSLYLTPPGGSSSSTSPTMLSAEVRLTSSGPRLILKSWNADDGWTEQSGIAPDSTGNTGQVTMFASNMVIFAGSYTTLASSYWAAWKITGNDTDYFDPDGSVSCTVKVNYPVVPVTSCTTGIGLWRTSSPGTWTKGGFIGLSDGAKATGSSSIGDYSFAGFNVLVSQVHGMLIIHNSLVASVYVGDLNSTGSKQNRPRDTTLNLSASTGDWYLVWHGTGAAATALANATYQVVIASMEL